MITKLGTTMKNFIETAAGKKVNYSIGLNNLKKLYLMLKKAYYNHEELVSDAEFDNLEDYLKEHVSADWKGFGTGVAIKNKKQEMKLPIALPSLNKQYPEAVQGWLDASSASDIVLMEKLDGASLETVWQDKLPKDCYTRGDGVLGKQMSYLLPHMKGLPKRINTATEVIIRHEGIFNKSAYAKYASEFKHARGAANGILNKGTAHPALKDLSVVVLQVLKPNVKLSKGLGWAKAHGFTVVPYTVVKKKDLTPEKLSALLKKRKAASKYNCDGLVLAEDIIPPVARSATKPEWMVAFKENVSIEDAPRAKIIGVVYKVSSHGWIIPKFRIEPTKVGVATVEYCSAKNSRWMLKNGVGIGAIVRLVMAGDIIPMIVAVEKKSNKISVPDKKEFGAYSWNEGKTEYVLDNPKENSAFRVAHITRFFVTLGIDFMKSKTVERLFNVGLDNVSKMIKATPKQIAQAEGIREGRAQDLYNAIHKVIDNAIPYPTLMDASGVFPRGIGTRRIEMITNEGHDLEALMRKPTNEVATLVSMVPGFNTKTAGMFAEGLAKFVKWQKITGLKGAKPKKEKVIKGGKLSGIQVYQTGYRNEEQEQIIKDNGGTIKWSSSTDVLLYSPAGKASGKIGKAKAKGIAVMTWQEFQRKYKL